jgi:hypothetical protein
MFKASLPSLCSGHGTSRSIIQFIFTTALGLQQPAITKRMYLSLDGVTIGTAKVESVCTPLFGWLQGFAANGEESRGQ